MPAHSKISKPTQTMVRNVGAGASPEEWFRSLPPITRWYFATVLLLTAAASFGVINPAQLTLDLPRLWQKFEVWRIPTSFAFFGGFSFPFLIQLYMLVQYSERYEASPFNTGGGGTTADYAWMLAFGAMVMMALALVMPGLVLFGPSMVFMILYMWARKNPESPASMFGFQLQAFYLPWALVAFHILIGARARAPRRATRDRAPSRSRHARTPVARAAHRQQRVHAPARHRRGPLVLLSRRRRARAGRDRHHPNARVRRRVLRRRSERRRERQAARARRAERAAAAAAADRAQLGRRACARRELVQGQPPPPSAGAVIVTKNRTWRASYSRTSV